MYILCIHTDSDTIQYRLPPERKITLGRSPQNDVLINDPSISRHHCSAQYIPHTQSVRFEDEGSTNGLFIDNAKVNVAQVAPGGSIQIGRCLAQVMLNPTESLEDYEDLFSETMAFDGNLFDDPDISAERLRALHDMSVGLSALDISEVLGRAASSAKRCLKCDELCFVFEVDENLPEDSFWNRDGRCERGQVTFSQSIVKNCMETGSPLISEGKLAEMHGARGANGVSGILCVPLLDDRGSPFGVLHCCSRDPDVKYVREDLQFLMLVASQVAIAICFSRSILELRRSQEQLKAAQLQLIQAAKLDSVGRLAAGVAHEVKNPLMTIAVGLQYLSEFLDGDQEVTRLLADMTESVNRADSVVRGLLDFSAPFKLDTALDDMNGAIEQSLLLVKHELDKSKVTVTRQLALALPHVSMDRTKIQQVFVNLFVNAAQSMHAGGTLTVSTSVTESSAMEGLAGLASDQFQPDEPIICVEVEDTGCGIPEDKLPKIFDPFFTTKPTGKGTGLGLSVVREIVNIHGGIISISNREAQGARATLLFPTQEGNANERQEESAARR